MTVYSDFDNELPVNRISAFVRFLNIARPTYQAN